MNPPDEAIVTAVVVLKLATIISLPAEISNKPTGERIRAIDRLVVTNYYQRASDDIRLTRVTDSIYPPIHLEQRIASTWFTVSSAILLDDDFQHV